MSRSRLSVDDFAEGIALQNRGVLARAITLIESNRDDHRAQAQQLMQRILPASGNSIRVGISGVPGVGKSSFIERLGMHLIHQGHRVAVLAIDPSSTVTRGSILGDKTRMAELSFSEDAFVRPSPTGGSLGGVARKTRESMIACEAAGFDVILVETVGVGQSETTAADMVDFFLVLKLAGAGDELQGIKRGILELADLIAINKADGANLAHARKARNEFERALAILKPPSDDQWSTRVVTCSAKDNLGIDEIWNIVLEHNTLLASSGLLEHKRNRQRIRWMWSLVDEGLYSALRAHPEIGPHLDEVEKQILEGRTTPTAAAEEILAAFGCQPRDHSRKC